MFTSSPIKRELLEEKKHLIGFAASACVGRECFHFGLCTTNLCNTKQNLLDITNLSYTSKTRKTTTTTTTTTTTITTTTSKTTTTTAAAAATAEKTTTTATTTTTKEQQKKISNSAKRIFDFKQILLSITLLIVSRW